MDNSSKALFIKFLHPCVLCCIHRQVEITATIVGLWSSVWQYAGSRDRVKPGRRWKLTFPEGLSKGLLCLDMGLVLHPDSPWLEYCFYSYFLSHVHCTFCCLCLGACMLPNWKLQEQWQKTCIILPTSGTRTFSSTTFRFSETLAQSKTTSWKQHPRETFLTNDCFDFGPVTLASLYLYFSSADGANCIQVMRRVHERVSSSNVISQQLTISERNVFQCSFVELTSGKLSLNKLLNDFAWGI